MERANAVTLLDRIDACSALDAAGRIAASTQLYAELDTADVDAVTWRAMGIELGVCRTLPGLTDSEDEFLRARAVHCHQRADYLGRIAARSRQSIPVVRV